MARAPRRHDLAHLAPGASIHAASLDPVIAGWLERWLEEGRPLVVTRQDGQKAEVKLGAVLPARHGRLRIACTAHSGGIQSIRAPLSVAEVRHLLPASTAAALDSLAWQLEGAGVAVGVYGSTAWEHLAGEPYRTTSSDVDLVCDVPDRAALETCLSALDGAARRAATPIDGEIRFPDGRAVAWRELSGSRLAPDARVLIKGLRDAAIVSVGSLLGSLP